MNTKKQLQSDLELSQQLSMQGQARRQLIKNAAMVAAGIMMAPTLVRSARSPFVGNTGRAVVDQLTSPANGIVLGENGDGFYHIHTDGIPDHVTGEFPNANCPAAILAQTDNFKITKNPKIASKVTPLDGWVFGVAVNGVVFDPTGPYYKGIESTGYQFEVLTKTAIPYLGIDMNRAHSQPSGEYHYHGMPDALFQKLVQLRKNRGDAQNMTLIGWAADGFPVYAPLAPSRADDPTSPLVMMRSSYSLRIGPRAIGGRCEDAGGIFVQDFEYRMGSGDLDECNGRFGVTPEFPNGIYHYFLTYDFPFIPRYWKGTPDASFFHPKPGVDAVPSALMSLKLG